MIPLPRNPLALWLIGFALGFAELPLLQYSGHLYYAEGGTSPDAPGMVFAAAVMTSPIWLGAWMAFVSLFLIRYPGGGRLTPLVARSIWGNILVVSAIAVSAFFLWATLAHVDFWRASRLPFTLHLIGCAIYVQFLRAAAVHRSQRAKPPRDS